MPQHRFSPLALVILCALAPILLSGCTAIGFGIGALADMSSGKQTPDRIGPLQTGTRITLWLNDGRKLQGRYLGSSSDSLSETPAPVEPAGGEPSVVRPRAVLLLGTSEGTQRIPTQDVQRVSVPVVRGKVIGLLTGLVLDAVGILMLVLALSQVDFS
jgi:hypothetical protein